MGGVIAVSRMSVCRVREMFVFHVDYFLKRVRDFPNFPMLWRVSVRHAKVANGNIKEVAGVNIHDTLSRRASTFFGFFWIENYPF